MTEEKLRRIFGNIFFRSCSFVVAARERERERERDVQQQQHVNIHAQTHFLFLPFSGTFTHTHTRTFSLSFVPLSLSLACSLSCFSCISLPQARTLSLSPSHTRTQQEATEKNTMERRKAMMWRGEGRQLSPKNKTAECSCYEHQKWKIEERAVSNDGLSIFQS